MTNPADIDWTDGKTRIIAGRTHSAHSFFNQEPNRFADQEGVWFGSDLIGLIRFAEWLRSQGCTVSMISQARFSVCAEGVAA